ncbi:MAG: hypothetical protein KGY46_08870, partial [Anaerolineales bacterium]|nr:hypothetical protein [Anaerolineales bacterium]
MVISENVAIFSKLQGLIRRPTALVGLFLVGAFVFLAIFGKAIAPHSVTALQGQDSLQPPSSEYWFGTDQFGRDVFSRVVVGSRYILVLA